MASKSLVIALDNSKACNKAVDFAIEHFPKGYTYHLLHVQPRPYDASSRIAQAEATGDGHAVLWDIEKETVKMTEKIMDEVFVPRAKSSGAEVVAKMVHCSPDGTSSDIGAAICEYVEQTKPAALVLMKENKGAIERIFVGSVTKYCATHCRSPLIIVPA
ncbi:g9437 [Coccomyxa elongata]